MASALERAIARHRTALLAQDAAAQARLAAAYQAGRRRIETKLRALGPALAADPTPGRVFQDARYRALVDQIDAELARLGAQTAGEATALQRSFVDAAGAHARDFVAAQKPGLAANFAALPTQATADLVGTLGDGSPLVDSLGQTFGAHAAAAEHLLAAGIASGQGLLDLGRDLLALNDGFMAARVMTTARTAPMTAYRVATLRTYEQNADILHGWVWIAALQNTTCLACLVKHGTIHPLTEQFFGTHPNCRCTPIPLVNGIAAPNIELGQDWFDRQPIGAQQRQMGGAAWEEYHRGRIDFADFLGERDDPRWGPTIHERSLAEIRRTRGGVVPFTPSTPAAATPDWLRRIQEIKAGGPLSEERVRQMGAIFRDEVRRRMPAAAVEHFDAWGQAFRERRDAERQLAAIERRMAVASRKRKADQVAIADLRDLIAERQREMDSRAEQYRVSRGGDQIASLMTEREGLLERMLAAEKAGDAETEAQLEKRRLEIFGQLLDLRRAKDNPLRSAAVEAMREARGAASTRVMPWNADTAYSVREHVGAVRELVPAEWWERGIDGLPNGAVTGVEKGRAYYHALRVPEINLPFDVDRQAEVAVHEWSHHLEAVNPTVLKMQGEFLARRSGGGKAQWLGGNYDKNEKAWADDFVSPYIGKDYQGTGYEVLSMGLEDVMRRDTLPTYLAGDPDFADFIFGLFVGV